MKSAQVNLYEERFKDCPSGDAVVIEIVSDSGIEEGEIACGSQSYQPLP